MSERFIPIAISSQLDVTGEEKIHAAPTVQPRLNRIVWLGMSGDIPDGYQGFAATGSYASLGGVSPYTFAVNSGTFPPGINLSSDGSWSGTRTTPGVYSWQMKITDAEGTIAYLDDTAETISLEVNNWTTKDDTLSQVHGCVAIINDTIYIGSNNNSLTYSSDQGASWVILSGQAMTGLANAGAVIGNIVEYEDYIYLFNDVANMSRAPVGTTSFVTVTNAPSATNRSATVLNGSLYCGVNNNGGSSNIVIRKMNTPGDVWTTIDTGIAQASSGDTVSAMCACENGFLLSTAKGRIIRTTDFATFTVVHEIPATDISTITFKNGIALAACQNGTYVKSLDDGLTWSSSTTPQTYAVSNNGYYFINSAIHAIWVSTDASSWTQVYDGTFEPGTQNTWIAANLDMAVVTRFSGYAVVGIT